jgi:glycosyltransferase involved in cell wall biosynthesis
MILKKVNIFFCTDGIFPHAVGGMQRHSRLLIEHLSGFPDLELNVIHPHGKRIFPSALNINELFVEPVDPEKNYLSECYRYSGRVFEIVKKHPESVIYSQGLCIWKNISKLPQPVIVNPHGLEPYQAISFRERLEAIPFKLIFNYIFKRADVVVSLGGMLTGIIRDRVSDQKRIAVLPNAVELPAGNGPQKRAGTGKLKLLFVARFAHNKGIHVLLRTIKELNDEGWTDKLEFDLGGKGPLFEHYSTNYRYKNVNYLGFVSDEQLAALYKNADVFVFPTLFEGMPTVVLEAMSTGLPVIVSDVGATAELVDRSNGCLIKKNSIPELKKAIIGFYNLDASSRQLLSDSSFNKVKERYNWPAVAAMYGDLFRNAAKDGTFQL